MPTFFCNCRPRPETRLIGRGKAKKWSPTIGWSKDFCLKNLSPLFAPGKGDMIEGSLSQPIPISTFCQNCPRLSGGKTIDRNLELQATRVCAVNCFSATHSRTLHPSDSPPQRDGSSCPSRARKRAPKSMPASPASRASEDDETVLKAVALLV